MEISGVLDRVRGKTHSKETTPADKWKKTVEERLKAAEKKKVAARFFDNGYADIVSITIERRIEGKTLIFFDSITKQHPRNDGSDVVILENGVPSVYNIGTGTPKAYEDQENVNNRAMSRLESAVPFEGRSEWRGKVRDLSEVTKIVHEAQLQVPAQSESVEQV